MFITWGHTLAKHRRLVAIIAAATLIVAIVAMVTVTPNLSSEGFVSDDAESARVDSALADDFNMGGDSLVFLFDAEQPASDPQVQEAVTTTLAPLADDPRFSTVATTWSTGNPRMVSTNGKATYAVVTVAPDAGLGDADIDEVIAGVTERAEANDLAVTTGGGIAINHAITGEVEDGLVKAETISIPLTLVILVAVFGSVVAAGVPLLIGAIGILAAIAIILTWSASGFQSIFAVNVISMLGLGLGIDYSLFMVTRFREEIRHRPTADAVAVTMATVGKAILFSGITVIFGLAATQFFDMPALQSMGQAGITVTAMALIYGLTLLPAVLAMLGPRVNAISIGRHRNEQVEPGTGFWHDVAEAVMHHPIRVLAPLLLVLILAGTPLLNLDLTPGTPEILPTDQPSRIVYERLNDEFPSDDAEPTPVLITFGGDDATTADNIVLLRSVAGDIAGIDGVTRVDSFVAPELAESVGFDWDSYSGDPSTLPAPIAGLMQATTVGNRVVLGVSSSFTGDALDEVVRDIRAIQPAGATVEVGGQSAATVDTLDSIYAGLLPAALFVLIGSYLILLLTFGSVFLPLKAIFMTLLSISASLGAVVFVFQEGHLEGLLGFDAYGEIISTTPILMFCILFGLSMDYEVLMLSRIQEEYHRTGDNRSSVAFGLSHTGKVITGAAAIMVVVFGGFIFADIMILKGMGFGLALAVLIDATIVRALLVPATMRLMGRWNWWAPAPVRSLVDRLGLSHHSTIPVAPADT